ncbi:MAG: flippase [Rivularia sp. (in: Bacteria)]|nr:flippase [Rivularia sp. MS3]
MSLLKRLGKSSFIYTFSSILQRGIAFLLLPLYTRHLTPDDYGILAVVTSLNGFLSVFFMLGLQGSMNRFYFDYRDEPEKLKQFWGTILTFILILTAALGVFLLVFGDVLLKPAIGDIPFYPFVAIGVATLIFQPFFTIYLALLQTTEKPKKYAIFSLTQFVFNLTLIIILVVFTGWGAKGALSARLITAVIFFIICLYALRKQTKIGINSTYLREALKYSFPLVPHTLAGQISSITDKVFLNTMINTATAGLYNIGFLFGGIMSIITTAVNRAYVPVYMGVVKSDDSKQLKDLKEIGLLLVVIYCLLGSAVSLFSKEVIIVFTSKAFWESYKVIPIISFNFVANGIYYLLVNILFYVKSATKFIAIATVLGAALNVLLNWLLIPEYGLIGAALATLISQIIGTIFVGFIGKQYEKVNWEYSKFIVLFIVSGVISLLFIWISFLSWWQLLSIKFFSFISLIFILSFISWNQPLYLFWYGKKMLIKLLK